MPDTPDRIGKRVRYWRLRRNLGRKQFADMIGRSTSWLDKVESGERELVRIPTIELVADALSVDPAALTDGPAAARAADCVDAAEVKAIRAALGRYPGLARSAQEPPHVTHLARQGEYLDHAWTSSHFTTIAQHLPKLLGSAQTAALMASPAEKVEAHRILVTSYRLASSMLLKFESYDLAWLAADRSMHTALARPGATIKSVAQDLGVNHETLRDWIRLDDAQRAGAPATTASTPAPVSPENENAELRKRIRELEEERDILRKAARYFAGETRW